MTNENLLDQFFLKDQKIINLMVELAEIKKDDIILEIGAGSGVITRQIARRAKKVIAIEIDKGFRRDLQGIQGKLEIIFADALKVLRDKKEFPLKFNKIVGSLPSSIIEPLMPLLTKVNFEKAVFLLPLKHACKLEKNPFFPAYFGIEIKEKISRKSFSPVPKTNWALVKIEKKPDPLAAKDGERFLRQYVYEHPKAAVKNALREGLIKFCRFQGNKLTKNEARKAVATKTLLSFWKNKEGLKISH